MSTSPDTAAPPKAKGNVRGRRTRERILHEAARLFRQRSFHGVGIEDIGVTVGMSSTALYRHFRSKLDLYVALLETLVGFSEQLLRDVHAAGGTPDEALRQWTTGVVDRHLDYADLTALTYLERVTLPEDIRRALDRRWRVIYAEIVTIICQARPDLDEQEAQVVSHAVSGMLNSVVWYKTTMSKDALRAMLLSAALRLVFEAEPAPKGETP
ncbi:MAG: TetR/AcrR family transcriptional regulator [Alphaproteobacteria bacterium]|nr:TetR/AcrR family transcriptional regulator [Alphaproteobacteria bacterium]MBU1515420.1 TetR/AcrR family transcriptional regulator [Alphaproteobacteria bacterium]MBU2092945.1 TetR/AcrR family transcriptional regulator [Alphaproteobacteria bacterium]MBU2154220.1 TetR/AcrR family transcriptional regulator [Alphaproteobacteria bacterium]MBU2307245.1 TetR/AcrR family transcriptional regulator [Alphaproteobacteria bacterium]